ncbi:hypothetical protein M1N23_03705, partial [Dehalococcoidia bacterium]|nr:hypothetical protein [Dehalococcoidia bacterium]
MSIEDDYRDIIDANDAIDEENDGITRRRSQAARLVDMAVEESLELFHDQRREAYVVLPPPSREILPVGGKSFRLWLTRLFWQQENSPASTEVLSTTVNQLSSMAIFDGPERPLDVRVSWHEESLWYDLGDWTAVRVNTVGWKVVDRPPVIFRHFRHQDVQCHPQLGGDFRRVLNFISPTRTDDDILLLKTAILAAMIPGSPRPAISLAGPHGSGKSTTGKVIKRIVDPAIAKSIRRIPKFSDLQLQLDQNWLLNIDNISNISPEISDALASAIT